jgi:ElaB/YqjD/DUF883 family membrane-anchored ribosome-binding protein
MSNPTGHGTHSHQGGQQQGHAGGGGRTGSEFHQVQSGGGTTGAVKDLASSVASRAEDAWDSAREGVQRMASNFGSSAEDAWDGLTNMIHRYPVAAIFVGMGIGFCLGQLFSGTQSSFSTWRDREHGSRFYPSHSGL